MLPGLAIPLLRACMPATALRLGGPHLPFLPADPLLSLGSPRLQICLAVEVACPSLFPVSTVHIFPGKGLVLDLSEVPQAAI